MGSQKKKTRPYGFDFLNTLSQRINDLSGFVPLSRELVQNADDEECEWISFEFTQQALVVRNPSVFSDQDFENIITIGREGKIQDSTKTGRFGIGFVSVYQICDHPVIRSNGLELTIFPKKQEAEEETIEEQDGTEFFLQWAREPTKVRKGLKREPITDEDISFFSEKLIESLPKTMLFLKHIRKIEVTVDSQGIYKAIRTDDENFRRVLVQRSNKSGEANSEILQEAEWLVFSEEPTEIVEVSENKRHDGIGIALPIGAGDDRASSGWIYCTLPTKTPTEFPFHINGDFAIKSDRMTLIEEGNPSEVEWNENLIQRISDLYLHVLLEAQNLIEDEDYVQLFPPDNYSNPVCQMLEKISDHFVKQGAYLKIIKLASGEGEWVVPDKARFISDKEEPSLFKHLQQLDAPLASPVFRSRWNLLNQKLGVKRFSLLDLSDVLKVWSKKELKQFTEVESDADFEKTFLGAIYKFIESELARVKQDEVLSVAKTLLLCPLIDGSLSKFGESYHVHDELFHALPGIADHFSVVANDKIGSFKGLLSGLCQENDLELIVMYFSEMNTGDINQALVNGEIDLSGLLDFLGDSQQRDKIRTDTSLKNDLAALPIYPAKMSGTYKPLGELSHPGKFSDPIGLDIIIDDVLLEERHISTLRFMGLKDLTITEYLKKVCPDYFNDYQRFSVEDHRVQLLNVIRHHQEDIESEPNILNSLKNIPCILCQDEEYRQPGDVYFMELELGSIFKAYPSPSSSYGLPLSDGWKAFLSRLGVNNKLKINDLLREIDRLIAMPFREGLEQVEQIFYYLASRFDQINERDKKLLEQVRYKEWLPVEGENIYEQPENLFPFTVAHLIGRKAKTLRFKREKDFGGDFRECIGLKVRPSVKLLIENLRDIRDSEEKPDINIYRELNNNISKMTDPEKITLSSEPLLYVGEDLGFVEGRKVFWTRHPFGPYRFTIAEDLRPFQNLMQNIMMVRNEVTHQDYMDVLSEIDELDKSHREYETEEIQRIQSFYAGLSNHFESLTEDEKEQALADWESFFRNKRVIITHSNQLKVAEHSFFADKEWAIDVFEKIEDLLVDKDPATWPFLHAIGVRPLSAVVQVEHFDIPKDTKKSKLQPLLTSKKRNMAFERIIETYKQNHPMSEWKKTTVQGLEITECDNIEVEFGLPINGKTLSSGIQNPKSHYFEETSTIYVLETLAENYKIFEISRKVANIINPQIDASNISPAISYILTPGLSEEEVHESLTYMGIDKLTEESATAPVIPEGEVDINIFEEPESGEKIPAEKDESTGTSGTGGLRVAGGEVGEGIPEEEETPDETVKKRKNYFKKRKEFYTTRDDFEESDTWKDETQDDDRKPITPEEKEEHVKLVKVFYNRQKREIEARLYRLESGEEVYDIYSSEWDNISKDIRKRDGNQCRRCCMAVDELKDVESNLTVHHIIPRKKGGSNWPSNLITLCVSCHREVENAPELL